MVPQELALQEEEDQEEVGLREVVDLQEEEAHLEVVSHQEVVDLQEEEGCLHLHREMDGFKHKMLISRSTRIFQS